MLEKNVLRLCEDELSYREAPVFRDPLLLKLQPQKWRRIDPNTITSARVVGRRLPMGAFELRVAWVDDGDREAYVPLDSVAAVRKWLGAMERLGVQVDDTELADMTLVRGRLMVGGFWLGGVPIIAFVATLFIWWIGLEKPLNGTAIIVGFVAAFFAQCGLRLLALGIHSRRTGTIRR